MKVTDIKLRRLTGNGTSTARDEENLRDDLLRVLITYLSQDWARSDPIIELEVNYTLDNDEPGLFILTKGQAPIKVLDQRLGKEASAAWGSREVGVTDGGLYDVGSSPTVIKGLRERPGASVLVLLSPSPEYLEIKEAKSRAWDNYKRYDCIRLTCLEHNATTKVLSMKALIHSQSLHLFSSISVEQRNSYIVLPGAGTEMDDAASARPSVRKMLSVSAAPLPILPYKEFIEDAALQSDLYNVWNSFKVTCEFKCKSARPPVSRYVVQQDLRFEANYTEGSDAFTFRYTGPELLNAPFRVPRLSYPVDYLNGTRTQFGQGLMGKLTRLSKSGDRLLVRVWHEGPLDGGVCDVEGNPRAGFCWPSQFCDVTLQRKEGVKTFYSLVFYHVPVTGPL